ncbi:sugar-binding transcriptional regulator [Streptococcus parauberis]|uniref:sugar-binding transcriptional regulator n=1 Tax=Streptococcus parauberis TaxID=1348 RepID=UPI000789BB4A|nr:sugar-binding transcriptional regulator [Streptococcus parauberis]KYP17106.1 Sorbitol operon regulator [Streptococcus parauberis]KYP17258.1 Sorbitol operon regulator [Streptococcus parauberis]KYP17339.1 Sorbitol operon regulator [Streptococcus parauberis]KYP23950.1 Sorbitol operon regulator [Streptococcus parauberis]KYP25561.1 Sorbitol operon regulator [Streptococcus parauberis]
MKEEKKRLLAKIAYMHYIEGKSQTTISKELDIYRTTVCRMLAKAKDEGIVKIEIQGYDSSLFALESYVQEKYGLKKVTILPYQAGHDDQDNLNHIAKEGAEVLRSMIKDNEVIGISWGSSISALIDHMTQKSLKGISIFPLSGGPSAIHANFHVNTLVYRLARLFHGQSSFINATVIQENATIAQGIKKSKYFEKTLLSWEKLDWAVIGIGAEPNAQKNGQWRDLLIGSDYMKLRQLEAVGEICCRFFDKNGQSVDKDLQERTIGISLQQLRQVPNVFAIACGQEKAAAILAALKVKCINYLVTDEETIKALLAKDGDTYLQDKIG